jgi:polyphosphate kinase
MTYTENRELSWLTFNKRVLEEAADEQVPLLERLKFISIFTRNLDEFFMVRVGSLTDLKCMAPDSVDNKTGQTPGEQLTAIYQAVPSLIHLRDVLYADISARLREEGIACLTKEELNKEEKKYLNEYYENFVRPVLSPQIIDPRHPFPHLANKALQVAAILRDKKGRKSLGLIALPPSLPAVIPFPGRSEHYVRLETLLASRTESIFKIYRVESKNIIAITRNADISFDEEKFDDEEEDYRNFMSKLLKKRSRLAPVRLEIQGRKNPELEALLRERLALAPEQVFYCRCPLVLDDVFRLEKQLSPARKEFLTYPPFVPRQPECFRPGIPLYRQVEQKDKLLMYPFEAIDPFLKLLKEAASDPEVASIKITLYRLAPGSKVAEQLCLAAENGKDVTVLIELRARFDEANNIFWAERLEQAGCRILYGMDGFKCHSKICLITRRDSKGGIHTITQIGTGNYNEKTAALYTDFCLLTARRDIGRDATAFFQNMLIGHLDGAYERLLVAPGSMKRPLLELLDQEICKGPSGCIRIKANSLTERDLIDKLAEASQAGVKIHLILRGICCLRPGIPGKTDRITVTSIVGRFLEHSRIFCFGPDEDCRIYLSSADLMTRNLTRRVEIACPVLDPDLQKQILGLWEILTKDNQKARIRMPDGTYQKITAGRDPIDSQQWLQSHSLQPLPPSSPAAENAAPPPSLLNALKDFIRQHFPKTFRQPAIKKGGSL